MNDRRGLLVDVSRTLFRVGSLISIVVVGQDGILGYDTISMIIRTWLSFRRMLMLLALCRNTWINMANCLFVLLG